MSVTRECMLHMESVNFNDLNTIGEMLNFLKENNALPELNNYNMKIDEDKIRLTHQSKSWTWIEINKNGQLKWDEHYKETGLEKDRILNAIETYYSPYVVAKEFAEAGQTLYGNTAMALTEDKQNIVVVSSEG